MISKHCLLFPSNELIDFVKLNSYFESFYTSLSTYAQANSSKIRRLRCCNCSMVPMGNHSKNSYNSHCNYFYEVNKIVTA